MSPLGRGSALSTRGVEASEVAEHLTGLVIAPRSKELSWPGGSGEPELRHAAFAGSPGSKCDQAGAQGGVRADREGWVLSRTPRRRVQPGARVPCGVLPCPYPQTSETSILSAECVDLKTSAWN